MKRTNTPSDALNRNKAVIDPGDGLPLIELPLDGNFGGTKGDPGEGVPTGGSPLQVVRKNVAGTTTEWATPSKSMVGLSNVDNTADTDKPISAATQIALDEKASATALTNGLNGKADLSNGKVPVSQLPTDALVTDAKVDGVNKNLIEDPASLTAGALSAAIDGSIPARPLPAQQTPCERIAQLVDFGAGFQRAAIAGDSTVNDGNDPMRKVLLRLAQLTPETMGLSEKAWASTAYGTPVIVREGDTIPATGGTVLTDSFNRVAAELVGSATSGGQVWAGSTGGWSADGSVASADNLTAALSFNCTAKSMTTTALINVVTSAAAANSQARIAVGATQANFGAGGSYVWAQLQLNAAGGIGISVWKRINGVNTNIVPEVPINGLTPDTATVQNLTVKIQTAIQAVTVTLTVGGVDQVLTASVTESDTAILGTFSGMSMPANASGRLKVDSVTMATPYTPASSTGLEVWNGAVGGTQLSYQAERIADMYPTGTHFDWLLVTGGHNYGTQTPESFIAGVDGFISAFKSAHPETLVLISSQNPQFAPASTIEAHARRQAALRDYAMENGFEYLPVFETFANQSDGGASLVNPADGIHPTVTSTTNITTWCGNLLWAAVWLGIINSRRQVGVTPPITKMP